MKNKILTPQTEGSLLEQLNSHTKGTLMESLGIIYTKIEDTYIEATMPVDERTCQPFGILHGGASLALAETITGVGSNLICPENMMSVGIQVNGNHIHIAKLGDSVLAKGTLIHKGKTTHLWNVDVFSQESKKMISSVRVTNCIIEKKGV